MKDINLQGSANDFKEALRADQELVIKRDRIVLKHWGLIVATDDGAIEMLEAQVDEDAKP